VSGPARGLTERRGAPGPLGGEGVSRLVDAARVEEMKATRRGGRTCCSPHVHRRRGDRDAFRIVRRFLYSLSLKPGSRLFTRLELHAALANLRYLNVLASIGQECEEVPRHAECDSPFAGTKLFREVCYLHEDEGSSCPG
jgi:hypothetical protein